MTSSMSVCLARLWIHVLCQFLSGSHVFGVWGVACGIQKIGFFEYLARQRIHVMLPVHLAFGRISSIFQVDLDSDPEVFLSVLTQNGEVCSADASDSCPARDAHIWKFFFALHVAGSCDDGAFFFFGRGEHLCQTQVPGGAGTLGVSLLGVPAHFVQLMPRTCRYETSLVKAAPKQQQQPQQQPGVYPKRAHSFCCVTFSDGPQRAAQDRSCSASKAATTALMVATRAAVDRCGPGLVVAPPHEDRRRPGPGERRAS